MNLARKAWNKYIKALSAINDKASNEMLAFIEKGGGYENIPVDKVIDYGYALATKYGEASGALSAEMYDAIAELSKANVPPAVPADTATYHDVAKAVQGSAKFSTNEAYIAEVIGRLVKQVGADTTLQNALRDGAQFAWIPSGDTCAFCITLASRGWQNVSQKAIKNGHAEHIHANCDCTYAVRFDRNLEVAGYDPEEYRKIYYDAEGESGKDKINSMRRQFYAKNKAVVGTESSKADEFIKNLSGYEKTIMDSPTETARLYKADGSEVDFGGAEHSVIGDASVLKEMEGGVLTHNHPTDVTFSDTDIMNGIVKGNLAELRAITINGNLHQLINENASIEDRRKFFVQFSERIKKFTNIANDKIRRGERINQQEYINSRLEQWLLENAPQYHLKYIKTSL